MKKLIFIIVIFFFGSITVYAEEPIAVGDIYASSGSDELNAGEILENYGISFDDPSSILSVTPSVLWEIIKNTLVQKAKAPLKLLISLGIIIILTSFAETVGDTVKIGNASKSYELICVLAGVSAVSPSICGVLADSAEALSAGAEFMTCFVPVFSAISAASGSITSASGYNLLIMLVADVAIQIADSMFMPLLGMCLCLAIVDASCGVLSLKGLLEGTKKIVTWGLGLIMTIFTGMLSIQSIVGTSADSVGSKTAKYVISNCVPLVGSAVSDAYSTVKGSIVLLKNGVGGVGIAALALILLPPLLSLALYRISVSAAFVAAEIFGSSKLSKLLSNIGSVLSAAIGVLVCFTLMFIVSTAIIMSISNINLST